MTANPAPLRRCNCVSVHMPVLMNMRLSLVGGGHTTALVGPCRICGGLVGFPEVNLTEAIVAGTPAAHAALRVILELPHADI